jgi:biotin-(acetyl-CoA carboxylase) ligase
MPELFLAHAAKLPLFSFFVANALVDFINLKKATEVVRLKWPNDLVVTRSLSLLKLGGILLEGFQSSALVAGFGINGSAVGDDLPPDAIALEDLNVFIDAQAFGLQAMQCVMSSMSSLAQDILASKSFDLQSIWTQHMAWMKGRHVEVRSLLSGMPQQGTICGLQDDGKLLLQTKESKIVALNSGEVKILFGM